MANRTKVAIVGGGLWGRALASAAAHAGSEATLISRRDEAPPEGVTRSAKLADVKPSQLVVLAVPSAHAESTARELGGHLDGGHFLVHGVRGLVGDDMRTISETVAQETPVKRLGALGGPVLAQELASGLPSVMVVGSHYREVLDAVRDAFGSETLRLYPTRDLVGLEWASALTGCLAIAVGYARGAAVGPGLVGAFTTRAVHEAARVAYAAGGEHATLLGLAGLGDLLAAVGQDDRPEIVFGRALAQGRSQEDARAEAGQSHIEALTLLPKMRIWAESRGVRVPILSAIVDGIAGHKSRDEMIHALMVAPVPD